jgi:hypothetical protein
MCVIGGDLLEDILGLQPPLGAALEARLRDRLVAHLEAGRNSLKPNPNLTINPCP